VGRSPVLSPFGALIGEIREEQRLKHASSRKGAAEGEVGAPRPAGPDVDLRVETRVMTQPVRANAAYRLLPMSLVLHAAFLLAMIVVPWLTPGVLPAPASATRVILFEPAAIAPPLPPPPPRAVAAPPTRPRAKPPTPQTQAFTAPVETPDQVTPEPGIDLGVPAGDPGGVEGGVPGGVVGGVVGGLSEPPPVIDPVRVGGDIKEPAKRKHVDPVYPDIAVRANIEGIVVLECHIGLQGQVTAVKVLRGIPLLNDAAVEAVRQWVYTPTLLNGIPMPVIMTVTVQFALDESRPPKRK